MTGFLCGSLHIGVSDMTISAEEAIRRLNLSKQGKLETRYRSEISHDWCWAVEEAIACIESRRDDWNDPDPVGYTIDHYRGASGFQKGRPGRYGSSSRASRHELIVSILTDGDLDTSSLEMMR